MLFHLTHFNAPRFFNKLIKSSMMYSLLKVWSTS